MSARQRRPPLGLRKSTPLTRRGETRHGSCMQSELFRAAMAAVRVLVLACMGTSSIAAQQHVDVLIRGGTVVDGTGGPPRSADVGIRGDRIAFVGDAAAGRITAARTVDARGLVVAPGFIDPHTHTGSDLSNPQRKSNLAYLMQGVTTVV